MANNTEIISALEKVINIFEETKFNNNLSELAQLYRENKNNSGSKTKAFKVLCKKDEWGNFSIPEISFLKSFEVYPYMGENSYLMCTELISNNFNDPSIIGKTLYKHYSGSFDALESCERLLKTLNDGHFIENKEDFENAFISGDQEKALEGVNYIENIIEEHITTTDEELKEIKKRLTDLEDSIGKHGKGTWKTLAVDTVRTIAIDVIKDKFEGEKLLNILGLGADAVKLLAHKAVETITG